jgi:hypothetical protein
MFSKTGVPNSSSRPASAEAVAKSSRCGGPTFFPPPLGPTPTVEGGGSGGEGVNSVKFWALSRRRGGEKCSFLDKSRQFSDFSLRALHFAHWKNDFGSSRNDFGSGKNDFSSAQNHFSSGRSDFSNSPNDFGHSRNGWGNSSRDFSSGQNDLGSGWKDFSGGPTAPRRNRKDVIELAGASPRRAEDSAALPALANPSAPRFTRGVRAWVYSH